MGKTESVITGRQEVPIYQKFASPIPNLGWACVNTESLLGPISITEPGPLLSPCYAFRNEPPFTIPILIILVFMYYACFKYFFYFFQLFEISLK